MERGVELFGGEDERNGRGERQQNAHQNQP